MAPHELRPDVRSPRGRSALGGRARGGGRAHRRGAGRPARWAAILSAAREALGDVDVHRDDDGFDLTHEATGIQASYDGRAAAISVPYWYTGAGAASIVGRLYALGDAVERATGLSGFDPQVELALAEAAAKPELAVAAFESVASALAGGQQA